LKRRRGSKVMRKLKWLFVATSLAANLTTGLSLWLDWFGVPKPLPVWQGLVCVVLTAAVAVVLAGWLLDAPPHTKETEEG
jgi:antibiotic biosynthesis monooxygenase (ABM) superfamily enzyme